ncbi:MAG TPA: hypothetical protein VF112_07990 [Candidatus Dormibacteraeota bacterium]
MPRRIEVPSADALFGGPAAPRAQAEPPAAITEAAGDEIDVRTLPPSPRRARRPSPPRADQGALRRLDELEAALAELPIDRLIELREELESLLAVGSVDADRLERVLELGRR